METTSLTPVAAGKRKAIELVPNKNVGQGKRQRTAEILSESDTTGDDKDELDGDEESAGDSEEEEEDGTSAGDEANEDDYQMDVDEKVKPRPGLTKLRTILLQVSSGASSAPKLRPVIEIITQAKPKRPLTHPADGLTATELENNWRLQVGDAAIKHTPLCSQVDCDYCCTNFIICWTIPGHTVCVTCRYEKKKSCSNTPPRN